MSDIGTCDLCNCAIEHGKGYVFYSATIPPFSKTGQETGGMHICDECTEKYINDEQFQNTRKMASMKAEEFVADMSKAIAWLQEANARGIIELCKAHGFSPEQAKSKAREFAELLWKNKEQGLRESTSFWTSKRSAVSNTPAGNESGCFIATACYGSAMHDDVALLRLFRKRYLIGRTAGEKLLLLYYRYSPSIARKIDTSPFLKTSIRMVLIRPIVFFARLVLRHGNTLK